MGGWAVANTLVIYNNTSISGNYDNIVNGGQYEVIGMAFDNVSGVIYAFSQGGVVSGISDSTDEVVQSLYPASLGTPASIAFDYKDNELFLLFYVYNSPSYVEVLSTTSLNVVATVEVGNGSADLVYDSLRGEVFASNPQSENVSVISTATNKVAATVALPSGVPEGMVYDSGQGEVFAINDQYDLVHTNLTVISDATNTVVATITVPYDAISLAYDSGAGEVFVGSGHYGVGGTCNVTVINDTTDTIVTAVDVGIDPTGITYVPASHELYVTNRISNNLSVISDATNLVTATVTLTSDPNAPLVSNPTYPVYDPLQGDVWFFGGSPGYVSGVSTSTDVVVATVWLTFESTYFAYDSAQQEEYLVDSLSGYVAVVSDVTGHVVAEIPVGQGATQIAYDSGRGEVWTTNYGAPGNISVINTTTNTVVATFVLPGVLPTGLAYDPSQGEMFVGNEACPPCSNITAINDTTYAVVAAIPTTGVVSTSLIYDGGKGEIFAYDGGGNVNVINATTDVEVATVGTGGFGTPVMAYDSAKGEIFLPDTAGLNVTVISDLTNSVVANISTGCGSWGAAYDLGAGEVFIGCDDGGTVAVISDATNTVASSIVPDGESPSSVAYDPTNGNVYTGDRDLGTLATLSSTGGTGPTHYAVTFVESGLPTGNPWTITFNATLMSSSTTTIAYSVLNGGYTYSVGAVSGYLCNVTGGTLTVAGGAVTVYLGFTSTGVPTYPVSFNETGLTPSTSWTVTLEGTPLGSTSSSIQFSETDGTYTFEVGSVTGYAAAPASGSVLVDGAPVIQDIVFTATSPGAMVYPVTFSESGLTAGTTWSVTLAGTPLPSSSTMVTTTEPNGSYDFTVTAVVGYTVAPASGVVHVIGAGVTVTIVFTTSTTTVPPSPPPPSGFLGLGSTDGYIVLGLILVVIAALLLFLAFARRPNYPVIFAETGLAPGTRWSVRLKEVPEFSDTETIRFLRPRGTYQYEVVPTGNYAPTPATGFVVVEREQVVVSIQFVGPGHGS